MATLREIRKRIRSIRNIAQVTRAMQTVSASKMRRAQLAALATRPYAARSWEVLGHLASRMSPREMRAQPLVRERPVHAVELVLVTANRGLCGGYNHNVIAEAVSLMAAQKVPVRLVTVGRKGRDFAVRHGLDVVADFGDVGDRPTLEDVRPIAHLVMDDLERDRAGQVWLVYTEFVSTLVQRPKAQLLLPIQSTTSGPRTLPAAYIPYLLEPSAEAILEPMLRRFTELQVYRAVLEALASEHSARVVAMRNATDNALRLIDEMTLSYNKARQEAITKELIDIIGGAAALRRARAGEPAARQA
ncbi:MAG: ATP synthase F1 subunit gamma [Anaerolineae bacterium]|nr:ATP synthase F1 subunit gamma [Anaerolineae bacterium]